MHITTYATPDSFLAAAGAQLEEREAENGLMLGVIARIAQYPERFPTTPYMAVVTDVGRFVLAATMTPPFKLALSYAESYDPHALNLIAADLLAGKWSVPGVLGANDGAARFADVWQRQTGSSYRAGMRMRVFKLTAVVPPPQPSGHMRPISAADRDLVIGWLNAFHDEAVPNDPRPNVAAVVDLAIATQGYWLWDDGGTVSMVARSRPTAHGITINAVYTPPSARGKGYASANVAALSQLNLDSGYDFCTLYTDLANPTSNNIYQKIGYRPVCDFTDYFFG